MTQPDIPCLLSIRQAAQYLGLSVGSVRDLQWQRKLPYYQLGTAIRFSVEDLEAYRERFRREALR